MIPQHGTLEISRSRLRHNLALLQKRSAPARLGAVVKANAYGHGERLVVQEMARSGVQWFIFYSLDEATAAADYLAGTHPSVAALALSPVSPAQGLLEHEGLRRCVRSGVVRVNVVDADAAVALDRFAAEAGVTVPVHVQVDAGLTRIGVLPSEALPLLEHLMHLRHLRLEGLFAHLSHGDEPGHETLDVQLGRLMQVAASARALKPGLLVHLQNSGGICNVAPGTFDLARAGIAAYGLQPSTQHPIEGLQPIARVVAPVLAVHARPAGTGVGYGHTFVTSRPSRLAIVPVGYADGYPRALSNRCVAQVRGTDVPVVGRVSMDQIILDVTDLGGAPLERGEQVTVIAWDAGKPNALDRMADAAGTIGYELATHLGGRLERVMVD